MASGTPPNDRLDPWCKALEIERASNSAGARLAFPPREERGEIFKRAFTFSNLPLTFPITFPLSFTLTSTILAKNQALVKRFLKKLT
jgi:hypothetical protein